MSPSTTTSTPQNTQQLPHLSLLSRTHQPSYEPCHHPSPLASPPRTPAITPQSPSSSFPSQCETSSKAPSAIRSRPTSHPYKLNGDRPVVKRTQSAQVINGRATERVCDTEQEETVYTQRQWRNFVKGQRIETKTRHRNEIKAVQAGVAEREQAVAERERAVVKREKAVEVKEAECEADWSIVQQVKEKVMEEESALKVKKDEAVRSLQVQFDALYRFRKSLEAEQREFGRIKEEVNLGREASQKKAEEIEKKHQALLASFRAMHAEMGQKLDRVE